MTPGDTQTRIIGNKRSSNDLSLEVHFSAGDSYFVSYYDLWRRDTCKYSALVLLKQLVCQKFFDDVSLLVF